MLLITQGRNYPPRSGEKEYVKWHEWLS